MLFSTAEKSRAPEKGPLYGHHSTRLRLLAERERWREKGMEKMDVIN